VTEARLRGQEYLLERRLFHRRSTGQVIERDRKGNGNWTRFAFPTWWHYDVLRGLDYLRGAGVTPDERLVEAIGLVASKRDGDGRWLVRHIKPAGRQLGLSFVNWRCLRTSYATWLKEKRADPKDAQALMRHSRIQTTLEIYQQHIPESQRRVVDALVN
jgi:integrase